MKRSGLFLCLLIVLATLLPLAAQEQAIPEPYQKIRQALGQSGALRDGVYTLSFERGDLVVVIDGEELPPAAGLCSTFHFYRGCCGRILVSGQFCLLDHELNDVIDELRKANIRIGSSSAMFVHARPAPLMLHFQGSGEIEPMTEALKAALGRIGKARAATRPEGEADSQ